MVRELSEQEINEINNKQVEETAREFKQFKKDLSKGRCWLCKEPLTSFDETKPCVHWLLCPQGFRKKHTKKVLDEFTYDRIEGYLRWYVNTHAPFRNINDLVDEHDGTKLKALTITHENLEWSFSFAQGCLTGEDGVHGPHYHFQMRIDGRPFYNYNDRHVRLNDYELWVLDVELGKNPLVRHEPFFGMGMQGAANMIDKEDLLNSMITTDDHENATYNVSTLVMADKGHTISGDDIADLIEESKKTNVPMHRLLAKLNNVKSQIHIEPGGGVPQPAQRLRPRKKK